MGILLVTLLVVIAHGLVYAFALFLVRPTKRPTPSGRRARAIDRIVARETAHLDRRYRDLCH